MREINKHDGWLNGVLFFAINCCRNQLRLNICLSDNHDEDVDSS